MKAVTMIVAALVALGPAAAAAQPPEHAKAHGWRKKNDPTYPGYQGRKWEKDYDVSKGGCNSAAVGAVLGGATGGAIGAKVSSKQNRAVAVIVGTTIGAAVGAKIGQQMDNGDRGCMGHALELAGEKKTVAWTNKNTGVTYRLTPTRTFKRDNAPCREFTAAFSSGKKQDSVQSVACRSGDGEWILKR
jgi:surface antigen